ncbi:MAG: hypothetical protein ACHQO8_01620 [Vicinamibacterales bacterium]
MSRLLAAFVVLTAATASLVATEIVPMDFREVVADATLIVRGHVTDTRGVADPAGVSTVATVAVDRVLKGQAEDFISVRVPGGTIGRYRYVFVGAPTLAVSEQAVFLLKRGPDNALRPVGLTQGIYEIRALPGGQPVVAPPLVAPQTAAAGQVVRGDARRKLMAVAEFESLVRLVMAGQSVSQGGRR